MRLVPLGKLLTVGEIRKYFAGQNEADFTDPITAGIFVSIVAWASSQRENDVTPYWRTLKAGGELNSKYPGGAGAQKACFIPSWPLEPLPRCSSNHRIIHDIVSKSTAFFHFFANLLQTSVPCVSCHH